MGGWSASSPSATCSAPGSRRRSGGGGDATAVPRHLRLRDRMTTEVVTAHPDADLGSAVEMMLQQRIGCLPVVENDRLVGLLGETDCLRQLARLLAPQA